MCLYEYLPYKYYYALFLVVHYDIYPWDSIITNTPQILF